MQDDSLQTLFSATANLEAAGRASDAIGRCRAFLARDPKNPEAWCELGRLLRGAGAGEEALTAYGEALRFGIDKPEEIHLIRAVILTDQLRRDDEAEAEFRKCLIARPDYPPALLNLGNLAEERGRREDAMDYYRKLSPDGSKNGLANDAYRDLRLLALARLVRLSRPESVDDPLIETLEVVLEREKIDEETCAALNYSLGETFDRIGEYGRAFSAFEAANRAQSSARRPFRRGALHGAFDRIRRAFPSAIPGGDGGANSGGAAPIFVCGMLRSGSTLVEQVLAAHPEIEAGGELNALFRLTSRMIVPFPEAALSLKADKVEALRKAYFAEIDQAFPGARAVGKRITDKRPDNFMRIGLIKRLFPEAKIVHTIRDARDTCLSNYFQHLEPSLVPYANDLGDLGAYYREYQGLMDHWKNLLGGSIHDFDYDAFVADPRGELEKLLAFLDLPWCEECLSFHCLENSVKTASYWQVREPLYARSSGRWRHYEDRLAPLLAELSKAETQ
ncbi:MAG: sulfotransferase [Parvularculaceae bacterium]